jgi:penicillin-binding protein 1A
MKQYVRIALVLGALLAAGTAGVAALIAGGYYYVAPSLPAADELRDLRLQIPLSVYTRDGRLMAKFGEERRTPVKYDEIPPMLVKAVLAAEDDRFFEHPGFDYQGILRAGLNYLRTGSRRQGGSTITQQVAREHFLSRERTFVRKFKEAILAVRIEHEFSKQEILELYLNTYFFGQHAYGIRAAAQTYFGKDLSELSVAEVAMLAGIPQAPSILNPVANPAAAKRRRGYVLGRMRALGEISQQTYLTAMAEPVESKRYGPQAQLNAPYVAEMVRAEMIRRFGPAAYTAGLKVKTTIDSRLQRTANAAARQALIDYDERHGYRGPLARLDPAALTTTGESAPEDHWQDLLDDYPDVDGFYKGLVIEADENEAQVYLAGSGSTTVGLTAVAWAAPYINDNAVGNPPTGVSAVLSPGDVVRFRRTANGDLRLAQIPDVQGSLVALDPQDGAIVALVGGFDFFLSNYNRATQSKRQPGSAFKPFVYSAALENGFTPATVVNDAPLALESAELEDVWRPENYSGSVHGPTRLREALVHSLNLVSVRVMLKMGPGTAIKHLRKFGFDKVALPVNASLALGAGGVAPLDLARGYVVFASGGYRVDPYFIEQIEDADGDVLYTAHPSMACASCDAAEAENEPEERTGDKLIDDMTELYPPPRKAPRVITPQNAYLITDMMQDVIRRGTGRRALQLGRSDLAGKTGTSNDRRDTWFAGFNADIVTTVWVGFDQDRSLGNAEEGARTALPMWNAFMAKALEDEPAHLMQRPPGIIDVRIDPETGLRASSAAKNTIFEKFRADHIPAREPEQLLEKTSPVMGGRPKKQDVGPIF